jgi:uncharacterized membrane protein
VRENKRVSLHDFSFGFNFWNLSDAFIPYAHGIRLTRWRTMEEQKTYHH